MSTREELVKAMEDASDAWYAADDARDAAEVEYNNAKAALEEKGGGKIEVCPGVTLDQFKVALLTDDKSEEFDNWCKESDD